MFDSDSSLCKVLISSALLCSGVIVVLALPPPPLDVLGAALNGSLLVPVPIVAPPLNVGAPPIADGVLLRGGISVIMNELIFNCYYFLY